MKSSFTKAHLTILTLFILSNVTYAQLGDGWKQHSPTKKVHLDDQAGLQIYNWTPYKNACAPDTCADYRYDSNTDMETFRILDTRSNRSEIRLHDDYRTGSRQFEGYVTFYAPLNDESLMQVFGSISGATQMMLRGYAADGGSIRGAGKTVATNVYGKEVRVNVIHLQEDVGNKIIIYIDGVKMAEIADNESVSNYHKYGNYGTMRTGEAVVQWRKCRFFRDGTAPETTVIAAITAPANGTTFNAPADIKIDATAFDNQNSIARVEFFNGSAKIGEDIESPYSFTWTNVAAGNYNIVARATNSAGQVSLPAQVNITVNGPAVSSFDITDNGGTITAQYANTSKPSENFPSLIDNSVLTKYFISNRTALWTQYHSTSPAIVVAYTITSGNDVPTRDPRNWNLQGSNNGSSWVTLDSRTNEVFTGRRQTRKFTFENTTSYVYYRLNITANSDAPGTQFAEWELFERRNQTITFDEIEAKSFGDDPVELVATSSAGLPVTLEIESGPATLEENLLTITGAGIVTVRAVQAGNENYFAAPPVVRTLTINKAAQNLTLDSIGTKTFGDPPFELGVTTETNIPVTFEVVSGPASISGSTLNITGAGSVTVRASQAGNKNYLPASAEQTFIVNKAVQTISFAAITPKKDNESVQLSATATSGLPIVFSIISGWGQITGNTLAFTKEGNVTIRAAQPGNENYLPAGAVNQTVLVYADDERKDSIRIKVYPNPTHGQLKVKLDNKKDKDYTISVYNDRGVLITSTIAPKSFKWVEVDFDISNNPGGWYYLYVTDGTEIYVRAIRKL
jgi:hypothetical protein